MSTETKPDGEVCGATLDFHGETLVCVREPHDDWPHRTRSGSSWAPAGWMPDGTPLLKWEDRDL
jgi:hypothetical protein